MNSNVPNLFIVGAPKCGTTSLHTYLSEHPSVYMSSIKEPRYFAEDNSNIRFTDSLDSYLNLFEQADESHRIIGESSAIYLASSVAIKNIYEFNSAARLVVMLRNPVDLAYSLYSELVYRRQEDQKDFSKAWQLQEERKNGKAIPLLCREPSYLQYKHIASLGTQVEKLLSIFPQEQVKFVLFEDFTHKTGSVYQELLDFLDLPGDARTTFHRLNSSKRNRWDSVATVIKMIPAAYRKTPLCSVMRTPRMAVTRVKLTRLWQQFCRLNAISSDREKLDPAFEQVLKRTFSDEVTKLSELTGKNLAHWH